LSDDDLLTALAEAVAKQRGYADFYHWHDKRQKELGLLEALVEAASRIGLTLSDDRLQQEGKDPPDAWVTLAGTSIAVEFTEFVDRNLIEKQRREKQGQWRAWNQQEVEVKLSSIFEEKDHAGFGRGVDYWLVIHCDEPALSSELLDRHLRAMPAIAASGIARCFVLLSYDPSVQSYPLLEVTVKRAS
jgi:hypothetical protein